MKKEVYRIRIFVCLIALHLGGMSNAQIHVGPENNVGIKDSSLQNISLVISNVDTTFGLNNVNILSRITQQSAVIPSSSNVALIGNYNYASPGNIDLFGIENRLLLGGRSNNDHIYGHYNYLSDSLTNSMADEVVVNYNYAKCYGDAGIYYGINQRLFFDASLASRIGISNILYSQENGEGGIAGPQIGIYNYLYAQNSLQGVSFNTALYSGINGGGLGNSAGYFDGNVYATGSFIGGASDSTVKENIQPISYGLSDILSMNVIEFNYDTSYVKNYPKGLRFGMIAQQVEPIIPEIVLEQVVLVYEEDPDPDNPATEVLKNIEYAELIPILVKAIQEQQAQIDSLEQQIGNLQNPNSPKSK